MLYTLSSITLEQAYRIFEQIGKKLEIVTDSAGSRLIYVSKED